MEGGVQERCWCKMAWERHGSTWARAERLGERRGGGEETELAVWGWRSGRGVARQQQWLSLTLV